MSCKLCEEWSHQYTMTEECCQMRFVANMPRFRRQDYYQQVRREQGNEAANKVMAKVSVILEKMRVLRLSTEGKNDV